jgi:acetyl-CoA acetyltransferase
LTGVVLHTVRSFTVDCSPLHDDPTSITLSGENAHGLSGLLPFDIVAAVGVESMTRVPMFSSVGDDGHPSPPDQLNRYGLIDFPNQGIGAEQIADECGLSRQQLDEFSARSQQRALDPTNFGHFEREIVPVPVDFGGGTEYRSRDEGIRADTMLEGLAALPAIKENGKFTAGNSSQICDGASAVLNKSTRRVCH